MSSGAACCTMLQHVAIYVYLCNVCAIAPSFSPVFIYIDIFVCVCVCVCVYLNVRVHKCAWARVSVREKARARMRALFLAHAFTTVFSLSIFGCHTHVQIDLSHTTSHTGHCSNKKLSTTYTHAHDRSLTHTLTHTHTALEKTHSTCRCYI